jgi:protein-S-isoprenylcysteine O-methyltransferase Ste14
MRMRVVGLVLAIGWVAFWVYWLVSARHVKASASRWRSFLGVRLVLAVIVVGYVALTRGHRVSLPTSSPWLIGAGLALCAAGLALAVWARVYLGSNWGMPMARKEQPDLVETGPYRTIRHPIYTGILLGLVGSALATSLFGLIAVAVIGGFFIYSARREERYMTGLFPDAYPAYKHSTKMLVPFVF